MKMAQAGGQRPPSGGRPARSRRIEVGITSVRRYVGLPQDARSVPTASSSCRGTTQPCSPFLSTTWLPFCLNCLKPNRSNARMASAPETRRSLGICHFKGRQPLTAHVGEGKFFQV